MGIINILDKHTANLIAAGEVVERPASAIKEMLENSADAGASAVTVEIKDGGTSFIRITDDGSGMDREDVPRTILRHATSKIKTGADLAAIGTLGFRGEALAAIAAVSRIRILTKRPEDTAGTTFAAAFGEVKTCDEAGCPDGTTIIVEDLFENTPARRKFLKRNATEGAAVGAVCEKFALSRPEIAVTLISDGVVKLRSPGDGKLISAVYAALGKEFAGAVLPVDYDYAGLRVYGFIGKPEAARPNRNLQNFFVNGRYIKSRTMLAALEEGFRGFCPVGKFPACVLFLSLDLDKVDVNIHPAKLEVKFSDERQVFDTLYFGVKNALSRGIRNFDDAISPDEPEAPFAPLSAVSRTESAAKPLHFPASVEGLGKPEGVSFRKPDDSGMLHVKSGDQAAVPFEEAPQDRRTSGKQPPSLKITPAAKVEIPHGVQPAAKAPEENPREPDGPAIPDLPPLAVNPFDLPKDDVFGEKPPVEKVEVRKQDAFVEKRDLIDTRYIGEAFNTYLLVERAGRLYLIDKHAAHERIIYERIKHAADNNEAQYLLDPVAVTLTSGEYEAVSRHKAYFERIGFDYDDFGDNTYLIRSFPTSLGLGAVADTFTFLAGSLADGNPRASGEIFDRALFTAACKAAIKGGNLFTDADNLRIIDEIFHNDAVLYCPHGRPVLVEYTRERIEKMFSRT